MQYFSDRSQAGTLLADKMEAYARQQCVVVALSEGAVLVGAEIAKRLHTALYLLATEDITLPREPQPVATMTATGAFTYNTAFSAGELESITGDYHSLIEQERMQAFQKLNRIVGRDGDIPKELLKRHIVILVSDGLQNGLSLQVAADYVKPIATKKLIIATPFATVPAVDRMHILTDEIFCLSIIRDFISIDHYYENNHIPDHQTVVEIMKNIVLNW